MSRHLAVLIAFVLAVPFAESAPKPKDGKEPVYYYPTTVGDKWVTEQPSGDKIDLFTHTVTKVEKKENSSLIVSIQIDRNGMEYGPKVFAVSDKGVGLPTVDRFNQFLHLPLKAGETWEHAEISDPKRIFKYTTIEEEEVVVPAGKFRAIRVVSERTWTKNKTKMTEWFAKGLGPIKVVVTRGDKEERLFVALKSFTPGKK